jgi:uncharacterized membrane protein
MPCGERVRIRRRTVQWPVACYALTPVSTQRLSASTRSAGHAPSHYDRSLVLSSLFLGAASGLRSQLGLAAVVARSDPSLPTLLRHAWTKRVLMAGAAVELVVDKLPATPSRLAPVGITSRLVLGGLAAGLSARTRQAPWPPAAAIGASSAILAAKVGHDVRAQFARPVPDSAVAIVEDGLAFALASAGASR